VKKNILLIGSGKFIENTIFPAIKLLDEKCKVIGILNRSGRLSEHSPLKELDVSVTEITEQYHGEHIDLAIISVPPSEVISVLKKLSNLKVEPKNISITTPVIPLRHIYKTNILRKFQNVFAFEFVPHIPIFSAIKKIIDSNELGVIKTIKLDRCGYLYHAIATLRSWNNYGFVSKGTFKTLESKDITTLYFNDTKATIIEPRNYQDFDIEVCGSDKTLTTQKNTKSNTLLLKVISKNNNFLGITVDGINIQNNSYQLLTNKLNTSVPYPVDIFRQQCIIGSAITIKKLLDSHQGGHHYSLTIYEHLIIRLIRKFKKVNTTFSYLVRLVTKF